MDSEDIKINDIQEQYRLLNDIYVMLDDGDVRSLKPFGLTPSQYAVLALLEESDGHQLTTLSDRLLVARSTITRIIDQLEAANLVRRIGDPNDRRAQRVILTEKGVRQRDTIREAHLQSLIRRLTRLDAEERQQLNRFLRQLRDGLCEDLGRTCK